MMDLPPNFQVGQANEDGDCFFDSVAQGLKQLKPELDFTAKSLRLVCKSFAQTQLKDEKSWLVGALKDENEQFNEYILRIEFSANDFNQKSGVRNVLGVTSPVWGRSEIEGRVICTEYNVKLHIVEKYIVEGKEMWTHRIVDSGGPRSLDAIDFNNAKNTVHILNTDDLHFEPILRIKTVQVNKYLSPNQCDDSDEEDVEVTTKNELFYTIWSNDSEADKIIKIINIFKRAPTLDINFQGIDNDTCLHIAVRKKELKVVEFLVKKGARTDIKNNKNRTPLDDAKRPKRQDILKIMEPCVQQIIVKRNQVSEYEINEILEHEKDVSRITDVELLTDKDLSVQKNDQTTKGEYNKYFYKKRPRIDGIHGHLYEIELSMLLLLQAEAKVKMKKINSFHLATNMQEAGAFDDIVFKYKYSKNGVEKSNIIFLQAKHKEAEKGKIIRDETLLSSSDRGDFLLRKYLSSYIKINDSNFKRNHQLFQDSIDRNDFIIYTNAAFEKNLEKNTDCFNKVIVRPEYALHFAENPENCYYQLNANEKVKDLLKYSLDFEILVRELAQSVYSGSIPSSKDIFKDYHVSLANTVLQISEFNTEAGRLRQGFLDGTQNAELSCAFLKEIRKNKNFSKVFSAKLDSELKKELKNKIIKLPKNFGRAQYEGLILPLPDKTIPDETIEQFLKDLKLFFNQPNVNDIENAIKEMIRSVLNIEEKDNANLIYCDVHSKITKWWREQENVEYLTERNKLFKIAREHISNMLLVGLALLYAKRIKSLGLNFRSNLIQKLQNLIKEEEILHIINKKDTVLLSTLKVYQALEGMNEYKSKDDHYKYIFVSLTSALELQTKVMDAFRSKSKNLLVVECEETNINCRELCKQLADTIKCSDRKKLVLISGENDSFAEQIKSYFSEDNKYREEIDRNNTLADLDFESQAIIRKKQVKFQGIEVRLGTLVNEKSKHVVDAGVLYNLINNEKIEVDKAPSDLGEVKYYYINRMFYRRVNIKKEYFKKHKISDIFVVSNVKYNEFSLIADKEKVCKFNDIDPHRENTVRFLTLDDDENVQEKLRQVYTKYQTSNIHWVKKEGDKFIWKESLGSLSNLREFVDTEDIREYPADKITSVEDRIVIVSAEPGMGKSVLLTKLAEKEKETDPSLWVVRLNLNDYTKQLKKMNFAEINLNGTINFLSKIMDLKTPLEKKLFKHRVEHQGKIVFLFDGFDEISPDYKEKVIALVTVLKETKVDKLWITTRPHMKNELEDKFSVLSHSLKLLSIDDQKHFLKRFWGRKLDLKNDTDDKRLNTYIEELLKVWSLSIGDEERNFTGIPLQTRMLAEVYQDKFKEFFDSNQSIPSFPSKLNLFHLYQSFIDKKYKIYYTEKNKADTAIPSVNNIYEKYRSTFLMQHQLLALEMVLPDYDLNLLLSKKEKKEIMNFKNDIVNGQERTGVVNQISNGTLKFIHRTFAEYFAAFWIADNLDRENVKNLLYSKLFKTENSVLRNFFDRILASDDNNRDNEIHIAVLSNDIKKIEEFCSGSRHRNVDKQGRTALHLAAAYGYLEIAEILLNNDPLGIHIEDKIFAWRPLRYADHGHHWHVAELLLQRGGTSDDMYNAIANMNSVHIFDTTLLHTAAEYGLFKLTEFLIQKNANIHAMSYNEKTPLHLAAEKGHLNVVKLLIENGADYICQDSSGDTVLHCVAKKGNLNVVKFLMEKGADLNCKNRKGYTVLHSAAHKVNLDVVKFLTENGANLNFKNRAGQTVLHYAVMWGNLEVVKLLIEKGADFKCSDRVGSTVLHYAAEKMNINIMKFLIEKGADLYSKNKYGDTVLHFAAKKGCLNGVQFLIEKGANLNFKNKNGDTVLHFAAKKGCLDVVKFLTDNGANLNCKNKNGDTILHSAAKRGNWDVVMLLAEKGADFKCGDTDDSTVLHLAAFSGNLDAVKFLTVQGADFNYKNTLGNTVLHSAAVSGKLEVVKFLIEKGANLNCKNKYGNTVLHSASFSGKLELVKFLTKRGADFNCKNKNGDTVLLSAAKRGNWDVAKFLTEKGANLNCKNNKGYSVLHFAASSGKLEIVKFLTEEGADLNCKNKKGYSVLHLAASSGKLEVVKFLTEERADFNCKDKNGDTVLHSAAKRGNWDVAKFLTEKGANLNCKNKKGYSVLHFAASSGKLEIVKFLIVKGADLNCKNKKGYSVLHLAASSGKLEVVKFLTEEGADFNYKDRRDDTALHSAAKRGDVSKLLTTKQADFSYQNSKRRHPSVFSCFFG